MLDKIKNLIRKSLIYYIYKSLQSKIAAGYFHHPSKDMIVIGVTGTDGKSTTCNLIHKILNDNLGKTALFTTVNQKIGDVTTPNTYKMTNISARKTQEFLQNALNEGCKYCVLEVSSHGIDQKRVDNIHYDVGVLTNITEEHLDYHKSLFDYASTKKQLFQRVLRNNKGLGIGVLNKDDDFGKQRADEMAFKKTLTYGIFSTPEIKGEDIKLYIDHTEFNLVYLSKKYPIKTKLLGNFNVYNILAAISVGYALKISLENIIKSIEDFQPLDGRMNYFQDKRGVHFFIDYAHTPAALLAVLSFLQEVKKEKSKIITVFGAPGMRDQQKRPKMGEVVSQHSDIIILTDDDPDKEDRFKIIEQVQKGVKRKLGDDFWIIPDRELAIKLAYDIAKKDDIVLIAGKGHETVQLTNLGKRNYSDIETLQKLMDGTFDEFYL